VFGARRRNGASAEEQGKEERRTYHGPSIADLKHRHPSRAMPTAGRLPKCEINRLIHSG
jgi:hypothetical protein